MPDGGNALVVGERWLIIHPIDLAFGPLMMFNGVPPVQDTISPKTMAKTAVHVADSIKRFFWIGDISPPIAFCSS